MWSTWKRINASIKLRNYWQLVFFSRSINKHQSESWMKSIISCEPFFVGAENSELLALIWIHCACCRGIYFIYISLIEIYVRLINLRFLNVFTKPSWNRSEARKKGGRSILGNQKNQFRKIQQKMFNCKSSIENFYEFVDKTFINGHFSFKFDATNLAWDVQTSKQLSFSRKAIKFF